MTLSLTGLMEGGSLSKLPLHEHHVCLKFQLNTDLKI